MKKSVIAGTIALTIINIIVCANFLPIAPKPIANANAQANIEMYLFIEDINQRLPKVNTVVSSTQVGLYANNFKFDDGSMIIYIMSIDNKYVYEVKNSVTYFPIKDGVTYTISIFSKTITYEVPAKYISYDLQKPKVFAETMEKTLDNGSIVIGQTVIVHAQDNMSFVNMYVSKNGEEEKLYEDISYIISEDGTYTIYAVDLAGNYSDEFTITYYSHEPSQEPDIPIEPDPPTPIEPIIPDDPITPTDPTTPEEPITDSNNATSQDGRIPAIIFILAIVVVGVVVIGVYRRIKAKAALKSFDDDE